MPQGSTFLGSHGGRDTWRDLHCHQRGLLALSLRSAVQGGIKTPQGWGTSHPAPEGSSPAEGAGRKAQGMKGCVCQRQKELALSLTRSQENICKQMLPACVYPTLRDLKWKPAPHTLSLPFIIAIFQALGAGEGKHRIMHRSESCRKLNWERSKPKQQCDIRTTDHADPEQLLHPGQESKSHSGTLCQKEQPSVTATDTLTGPKHQGCSSWMLFQAGAPQPSHARPSLLQKSFSLGLKVLW